MNVDTISIRCIVCNKKVAVLTREEYKKRYGHDPPPRTAVLFMEFCSDECRRLWDTLQ